MTDIVVLGSLNMDLVVHVPGLPKLGETIAGHSFRMIPGGKGANQAVAAARLGASVAMIGRIGNDSVGEKLRASLVASGVGVDGVVVDDENPTGVAMIVVREQDGANSIVISAGANGKVSINDLVCEETCLKDAKAIILQFEIPLETVDKAARMARKLGTTVVLNPAPAYPIPRSLIGRSDYIILNETEAEVLAEREIHDLASARKAGLVLAEKGMSIFIITMGEEGALLVSPEETIHVPAKAADVIDTTAAGDAFVAAFTVAHLRGFPDIQAVQFAVCAGTIAVSRLGAQTSLPFADEVWSAYREAMLQR
jgi:ribokinase